MSRCVIGVPKEVKPQEGRVGITPDGVSELCALGAEVVVETGAGKLSGFSDGDYLASGATIVSRVERIYREADVVVKVKELVPEEYLLIPLLRHGLYYELGVNFPGIQVRGQSTDMEADAYVININEVPVARGKILQGHILVGEPLEQLQLFNIVGKESIHPIDGSIVTWVPEQHKEVCAQAGFRMWDISEYLILHLS